MIGFTPLSHPNPSRGLITRKVAGSLTGLAIGDAVVVLQANGGVATVPPLGTGLTSLVGTSFGYSVTSNNGSESSSGTSAYRISYGVASASPIPNASSGFRTADVFSRTGGGAMNMALALAASGTYTPSGRVRPISYVAISYSAGVTTTSAATTVDGLTIGTINGLAPTVSRFFSTGTIHQITAGVNSRFACVQIEIGVWESDFGSSPVTYTAGTSGVQALFVLSGT